MFFLFWMLICSTRDKLMKLPNNEQIVFLGNSHIECAINDTIVKNSFNFARSAEQIEFIYSKVKLLDKYNPQIDTIIIGFDNCLVLQPKNISFANEMYNPYFYDTYNFKDILCILYYAPFDYIINHFTHTFNWDKLYQFMSSYISENSNINNISNIGSFLYLYRDKLEKDIILRGNRKHNPISANKLCLYFLDQTIKYCDDNDLTLIFMCPPQHKKCFLDSVIYKQIYHENYSNIPFYDFRDLELPDSCFGDLDHLNYKGAKVFSEYIEKKVLHKQNYK